MFWGLGLDSYSYFSRPKFCFLDVSFNEIKPLSHSCLRSLPYFSTTPQYLENKNLLDSQTKQ